MEYLVEKIGYYLPEDILFFETDQREAGFTTWKNYRPNIYNALKGGIHEPISTTLRALTEEMDPDVEVILTKNKTYKSIVSGKVIFPEKKVIENLEPTLATLFALSRGNSIFVDKDICIEGGESRYIDSSLEIYLDNIIEDTTFLNVGEVSERIASDSIQYVNPPVNEGEYSRLFPKSGELNYNEDVVFENEEGKSFHIRIGLFPELTTRAYEKNIKDQKGILDVVSQNYMRDKTNSGYFGLLGLVSYLMDQASAKLNEVYLDTVRHPNSNSLYIPKTAILRFEGSDKTYSFPGSLGCALYCFLENGNLFAREISKTETPNQSYN